LNFSSIRIDRGHFKRYKKCVCIQHSQLDSTGIYIHVKNKFKTQKTNCPWFNKRIHKIWVYFFIGSFWKIAKSDSYIHHVCPLWTTELPLVVFSWLLTLENFSELRLEISGFTKFWKDYRFPAWSSSNCMKPRWVLHRRRNISVRFVEKIKPRILGLIHFSENRALRDKISKIIKKVRVTGGKVLLSREDAIFIHNKHKLIKCNTYYNVGGLSWSSGFLKHVRLITIDVY